jgi:CheY-like chemotaxis protein
MNTIPEILGYSQLHQENRANKNFDRHLQRETYAGDTRRNTQYSLREEEADDDDENKKVVNKKGYCHPSSELKQARFLIAESEKELSSLFQAYLDLLGAESEIVDNGDRALSTFFECINEGKGYDAVVLDTHLKGKKGLEVAKKIHEKNSSQKIILVTTSMKEQLPKEELQNTAIREKDILVMPFELASLSKLLINSTSMP